MISRSNAQRCRTARTAVLAVATATALGAGLIAVPAAPARSLQTLREQTVVTQGIDGDTFWVRTRGSEQRIRFIGVQAMETYHKNMAGSFDRCHGAEARERVNGLAVGKQVRLSSQKPNSLGRGRLLRSVAVPTQTGWRDLGRILIDEGLALAFPQHKDEWAHDAEYNRAAQVAAKRGVGLWNTDACGVGPRQDARLVLDVQWDADSNDARNVNGEWVRIRNLDRARSVDISRWEFRDAGFESYVFPARTVVPAGGAITLRVGKGKRTASTHYWGKSVPQFQNVAGGVGEGGYLLDPQGDFRFWNQYPCHIDCVDPARGALKITKVRFDPPGNDAKKVNGEWIRIRNTGRTTVALAPFLVKAANRSYTFSPNAKLGAGKSIRIRAGKGKNTAKNRYWRQSKPMLSNSGGKAEIRTYNDIRVSCKAWRKGRC